jgi:hypothetical protein
MIASRRGGELQRSIAMTLVLVAEHDKAHPHEVDEMFRQLLAHIRSARPHILLDPGATP